MTTPATQQPTNEPLVEGVSTLYNISWEKFKAIEATLDEVPLPMPRQQTLLDILGTMHDTQRFRDGLPLGQRGSATAPARRFALPQRIEHALLERTTRMRVDAGVDRLVADLATGILGVHDPQSRCYLLRRPARIKQTIMDEFVQRRASRQLGAPPAGLASLAVALGVTTQ